MCIDIQKINIEPEWKEALKQEFFKPYFREIKKKYLLERERAKQQNQAIFPPSSLLFHAFNATPFLRVRAVILGQDPYHRKGEAMGLCFSVPKGVKIPPSLRNIHKELERSLGIPPPMHGDLSAWAKEGVLMLNSILSVREGCAGSHKNLGWQEFTDSAIMALSEKRWGIFFLLWGNYAREKKRFIDTNRHIVLESLHPSPLAGNRFVGNNHFALVNEALKTRGEAPINWEL